MAGSPPKAPMLAKPRIREAQLEDAAAYVTAMLAGFEIDHQFTYRYPYRHEYPEDAYKASEEVFKAALANPKTVPLVAEVPNVESKGAMAEDWVIVAIACWEWKTWKDVQNQTQPSGFSSSDTPRRDMDPQRQKIFMDAITAAEKRIFGPEWGNLRMELADLACDPKFQRRGAGTVLTEWGLEKARVQGLPIMLTASPLGRKVYQKLGFRDLEYIECGVEGEEERAGAQVMVWTPEGWKGP